MTESSESNLLPKKALSETERKIDEMNKRALASLDFLENERTIPFTDIKFSLRGLIDAPRMALQTRITEQPPVLETNTLKIPFIKEPVKVLDFKPLTENGGTLSKLVNPRNALRLAGNIAIRTASFLTPHHYENLEFTNTNTLKIPFRKEPFKVLEFKPLTENGGTLSKLVNPRNALRLGANTLIRAASFLTQNSKNLASTLTSIPLVKAIAYRGRQTAGAVLTMAAHAGNVVTKTAALIHYTRKINLIKKAIKDGSTIFKEEHLNAAKKERGETFKNWAIASVATAGLIGGTGVAIGVGSFVAVAHTVAAASHGAITPNSLEALGTVKKFILAIKEESEHLLKLPKDQQKEETKKAVNLALKKGEPLEAAVTHLAYLEATIKDPKSSTQEKKQAFAQQKTVMELYSKLNPTFVSHETKMKLGITKDTKEVMQGKVLDKLATHIYKYHTHEDHKNIHESLINHSNNTKNLSEVEMTTIRAVSLDHRTYAGKSGSR